MRFIPNLLRYTWYLVEGLATESIVLREILFILQASCRHANIVEEYSQKTADSVAILLREPQTQLPILLEDSKNL
jgi:hypothetical protein